MKDEEKGDQIDEGGQYAGDHHHSQPETGRQGNSKVGSELFCIVDVPEVAKEGQGDDGDGNETKGEVPPQLH